MADVNQSCRQMNEYTYLKQKQNLNSEITVL